MRWKCRKGGNAVVVVFIIRISRFLATRRGEKRQNCFGRDGAITYRVLCSVRYASSALSPEGAS